MKLGKIAGLRLALLLLLALYPRTAQARINGIASTSCSGCHGSGATVSLSIPNVSINPGDQLLLTVTVTGSNTQGGGFYITTNGEGTFGAQTLGSPRMHKVQSESLK